MNKRVYKLKDICHIKSGKRIPLGMEFSLNKTEHPYIRARDIKDGKINTDDMIYIDDCVFKRIQKYIIQTGDIAITIVGASVGDVAYADKAVDRYNLTENAVRLTSFSDQANAKYVFYQLVQKQFHDYMQTVAGGAAQPKLGIYKVERIKVVLPSRNQQDKIVNILNTYNNLIEVNNKRIKVLEQMAENLYKEWFVRFRFPGHENAEFENGIPKEWELCKFSSVSNILSGGTPNTETEEYYGGDIPFYTPKDSTDNCFAFDTGIYLTEEGLKHCNSQLYPAGTIMITARGTVGNLNLIAVPMAMNQSCYALNSDIIDSQYFLYFLIKREIIKLKKMASGGVFDTIIISTFDHIKVLKPNANLIKAFDNAVSPIMQEILKVTRQNKNLTKQRDLLLPRLMSGKLEV